MDHYTTIEAAAETFKGSALAIGNFDGVHRGHAHLLSILMAEGAHLNVASGLLTFEPHPRKLFQPDNQPFRITPAPVKLRRFRQLGLNFICAPPFDWAMASLSAEDFIHGPLSAHLQPAMIVVGSDFRFGQLRRGTPQHLVEAGFDVRIVDKIGEQDTIYSSSSIREALHQGDIDRANAMLGWDWEIEGTIIKGDQRGRELGYPTANVPLGDTLHPAYGIYATLVQIEGEEFWRMAATNIGIRPMFEVKIGQVEAHILDFSGDIYGKTLRIRPIKRLRGEARFDSLDALIAQMDADCREARMLLNAHPTLRHPGLDP